MTWYDGEERLDDNQQQLLLKVANSDEWRYATPF